MDLHVHAYVILSQLAERETSHFEFCCTKCEFCFVLGFSFFFFFDSFILKIHRRCFLHVSTAFLSPAMQRGHVRRQQWCLHRAQPARLFSLAAAGSAERLTRPSLRECLVAGF